MTRKEWESRANALKARQDELRAELHALNQVAGDDAVKAAKLRELDDLQARVVNLARSARRFLR